MTEPIEYSAGLSIINDLSGQQTIPIFASDIGSKGAKRFYTCGYEYFINKYYMNNLQRHEYEVLQWNKPTKIFFDLDCPVTSMTHEAFVDARNSIIEQVRTLCLRYFEEEHVAVYILESVGGSTKHSSHLIFDIVLDTMEDVKQFVSMISHPIIDKSVYTRNRCFRIMGSSKRGSLSILTPSDGYTVFQTLVQAVIPESYIGLLRYHNHPVHSYSFSVYHNQSIVHTNTRFTPPDKLSSFVSNVLRAKLHTNGKQDDKKYSFIIQGLYCPFAKKVHKSNNAFLNINKDTMNGWIVCADNECPKSHFWNMNFLWTFV